MATTTWSYWVPPPSLGLVGTAQSTQVEGADIVMESSGIGDGGESFRFSDQGMGEGINEF